MSGQKFTLMVSTLLVASAVLTACGRNIEPEESCNFVQNSQQQRVSWQGRTPVKMFVHESVPKEYYQAIRDAVKEWNVALNYDALTIVSFGTTGENLPKRDGYSVIYWMKNRWELDRSNEQARTTVYWSGTQIYEADIRVNDFNFDFFVAEEEKSYRKVHFTSLMVHEFGHVLGLAHNDDKQSVMQVSLSNGELRDKLGVEDKDSLSCEYGS